MASRSAREVAYETIRSRIITMDLKPGDELNDRELAEELGSVEAADALLHSAGLDDLLDEQHWQAMLLPPASAEAAPEQPVLRLEAEPAAEEVPAAMAS